MGLGEDGSWEGREAEGAGGHSAFSRLLGLKGGERGQAFIQKLPSKLAEGKQTRSPEKDLFESRVEEVEKDRKKCQENSTRRGEGSSRLRRANTNRPLARSLASHQRLSSESYTSPDEERTAA